MGVDLARSGFNAAEAYQCGRPGYAPEAVARLVEELRLDAGSRVLDLAAGTGQLGRLLAGRVGRLVAVEPSADMRRVLAGRVPGVDVQDGEAEAIPLEDGAVDAVVVAEAFHWFATDAALAEIARVLVPGGALALLWNVPVASDPPLAPAVAALPGPERDALLARVRAAAPDETATIYRTDLFWARRRG